MSFLIEQLRQLGMVAVVMVCAFGGTVGILKLIKHFTPGKDFPKNPLSQKLEENMKKQNKEN
ncbi:hypothetical protein BRYFOR_05295 [Marvinbryantia formatexigens DSM 14469]|uniref:Uncharacterized protein n=1 Tax=Marvinbryantia formatexigens DSM 14469 TaxID=478749 RepID=C6L9K5_9FIRM|nr:hypothetical protein [Marvinbryantia formatexigens]EET62944.1 hypothetical protein BRYFOR_05295 [Marvinbryantia formatexigens DSM 14469]UWO23527.1 hypothetical protein NQ534_13830 [Marvinbryantia formatexigens DSM 14469]SDG55258.1 hypothetical protein SAMN05660368_02783 [Marvinbryantia formatexigens]